MVMCSSQAKMSESQKTRRSNKPLMERRRRERINQCLNQLKTLVLTAQRKDPTRYSKLEKADILEMTVRHVQSLQRQEPGRGDKYRAGFTQCAAEIAKFLASASDVPADLHCRVLKHLSSQTIAADTIHPSMHHAIATSSATTHHSAYSTAATTTTTCATNSSMYSIIAIPATTYSTTATSSTTYPSAATNSATYPSDATNSAMYLSTSISSAAYHTSGTNLTAATSLPATITSTTHPAATTSSATTTTTTLPSATTPKHPVIKSEPPTATVESPTVTIVPRTNRAEERRTVAMVKTKQLALVLPRWGVSSGGFSPTTADAVGAPSSPESARVSPPPQLAPLDLATPHRPTTTPPHTVTTSSHTISTTTPHILTTPSHTLSTTPPYTLSVSPSYTLPVTPPHILSTTPNTFSATPSYNLPVTSPTPSTVSANHSLSLQSSVDSCSSVVTDGKTDSQSESVGYTVSPPVSANDLHLLTSHLPVPAKILNFHISRLTASQPHSLLPPPSSTPYTPPQSTSLPLPHPHTPPHAAPQPPPHTTLQPSLPSSSRHHTRPKAAVVPQPTKGLSRSSPYPAPHNPHWRPW